MSSERSVPHDPALPVLGEIFASEGLPSVIAGALTTMIGSDLVPEAFDVRYVRYRPGKSCVVLWARDSGPGDKLMVSARLFHDDRAERLISKEVSQAAIQRATELTRGEGVPYRYFPEQRLLVQLFPLDLQLPHLVLAGDPSWLAGRLSANGTRQGPNSITAVPESYKPWRRCVYRYAIDSGVQQTSYYAKVFRDDRGADLLRWHGLASETLAAADAPWSIPTATRYLPDARMLLFEALEGTTKVRRMLRPALKDHQAKAGLLLHMVAAAQGLAAFQQTQIDDLPSAAPEKLIEEFRRDGEGIGATAPELASRLLQMLDQLQAAVVALPPEQLVPAHGAFRHDQLLATEGGLVVLDLDTVCRSGASADAGNFLGYLDLTGIRRPRLQSIVVDCARMFEEAYCSSGTTSPAWVAWYRAIAHVKKALRAFFTLETNWPVTAEQLFLLADDTLLQARAA